MQRRIPLLIELRTPDWERDIEGLTIFSRLGNIVTAVATPEALEVLTDDPAIASLEASRDAGFIETEAATDWIRATNAQAQTGFGERGDSAFIGIVDTGVDVLHRAFLDENGGTRLHALWDQRETVGPSPSTVDGKVYTQSYGRLYRSDDIQRFVDGLDNPSVRLRDPARHGTHVASIAAGSPVDAAQLFDDDRFGGLTAGPTFDWSGGVAPESRLIVVIPAFESEPGSPLSLGYSVSHVDALAFIKATVLDDPGETPAAVNISLGMNAGAHDGSSLLEASFDEFTSGGRDPGFVIVKSAGNERGFDGHTQARAFDGGVSVVEWLSEDTPRTHDYIEFWYRSSDDLEFTLQNPTGASTAPVSVGKGTSQDTVLGATRVRMVLERYHHDNGDSRLAVTLEPTGASVIQPGVWLMTIVGSEVRSEGVVDAWAERMGARAVRFRTGNVNDQTLSIPGTARTVVTVGNCEVRDPLRLAKTSSWGPTRDGRHKPDLVAPGVGITAALGGHVSTGMISLSGTSMSAPHVTGAVALLLSRRKKTDPANQLNAAQVGAALRQELQNFTGRWHEGFGYGRLDVLKLLEAFE
ncbi:MAG: S8 family serine peptidase [Actinomycetia bacterium]|nr:S8 family serine peptidase [Actinomycetes bacterium]MCP5030938.1 S8 family serine peptidase [Actinomycetes bacterium]